MGKRSKAATTRINNLKKSKIIQKPPVEEVSDDEDTNFDDREDILDHGFFFVDEEDMSSDEDDLESESEDEELDEDELDELANEAALNHFNAILSEAQKMAIKAEQEAAGQKPKRKQHYTGNSARTKRYHAQKRRELALTGQKLISSMFSKKETRSESELMTGAHIERTERAKPCIVEVEDDSESSNDEGDEIEESMRRLFPEQGCRRTEVK
jgi:hypothetical protein